MNKLSLEKGPLLNLKISYEILILVSHDIPIKQHLERSDVVVFLLY